MVSQSSVLAKLMVLRIDSFVSPGRPRMKSPWMTRPRSWQSLAKSRARSTVAPFLMFLRICGSPDSKPTISRRQPASFMAFSVSRSVVTREVQDQVRPSGFSFSQSSMVRAFWMLKVSSSKKNSFTCGEVLLRPLHLGGHVVGGALAPGVAAERLRPQAEGALRRAAARGVERDVGMQQEGHVVAASRPCRACRSWWPRASRPGLRPAGGRDCAEMMPFASL